MNEINIHRGRSKTIRVPVIYKDGTACILSEGDYIFFAVRAGRDGEVLISKMMTYDSESNKATLTLKPEDTEGLEIERYHYDIGVSFNDGGYKDIIKWAEFNVLPSAGGDEVRRALVDSFSNTSTYSVDTEHSAINVKCSATGGTEPYNFTVIDGDTIRTTTVNGGIVTFTADSGVHYVEVTATETNGVTKTKSFRIVVSE